MAGEGGESTACARTGTDGGSRYASTPKRGRESASECQHVRARRRSPTDDGSRRSYLRPPPILVYPPQIEITCGKKLQPSFIQRCDVML